MPRKARKRSHGHGSVYQRGGEAWRIRWRENGQRRHASGYETREKAEEALRKIFAGVADARPALSDRRDVPTLGELAKKWLERREHTHRAWRDDRNRWNKHLKPTIGHLRPAEVDQAAIRRLIEAKLIEGLSSTSCKHVVRLLSTFYTDVVEQGYARHNPARNLPRATRRLIRDAHDPRQTPFVEKHADIARIYAKLAQPFATIFVAGALTGLRPGELLGLEWGDVDLATRRILVQRQVRHGKIGPTKSGKPRLVPIVEPLSKVLAEWKLATGGEGLVFKPLNPWRKRSRFIKDTSVRAALRAALKECELPQKWTWYHLSRHTYAAQHVMGGGSLATLREILGHSSVTTTERYAHLRPDLFKPEDLLKLSVGLSREGAAVVELAARRAERGEVGRNLGAADDQPSSESAVTS